MNKETAKQYKEAITKRNIEIDSAIRSLTSAKENPIDTDAAWDMYNAEDAIRAARDYNVEATELRKAGR